MNHAGLMPMRSRNSPYSDDDPVEHVPTVADQIHLVHEHGNLADADHRQHVAMAPRVFLDALLRVDHEQRRFGARRASNHVLQELDVAGCVEDDVVAARGLEEDARRVDGDPLNLFVSQRVKQKRVSNGLAFRSHVVRTASSLP